jgi:AcrR family transcriptional regulator
VPQADRGRTRLDPQVRRGQIIDAAMRVFADRDPLEVTFEEIAEGAGVSRALVYNYFGDRGGLLAAVYVETFERMNRELDSMIVGTDQPEDRLRAIVRGYLRFALDHAGAWRLLHATSVVEHPAVQAARRRHMERLAAAWGASGAEGNIVARGVIGLLESATVEWLRDRDADPNELGDVLFALLWTGLSSLTPASARL